MSEDGIRRCSFYRFTVGTRQLYNLQIGLMREGVLLAEQSPKTLLQRFQCSSLEEVFLNLSIRQHKLQNKTDEQCGAEPGQLEVGAT